VDAPSFCRNLELKPNRLLILLLPAVEVEFLPLAAYGGVGGGASSERAPNEPIVADRPLRARRIGVVFGEDRDERTDLVESLRRRPVLAEARFSDAAARAT
jgi:hypothetical protein